MCSFLPRLYNKDVSLSLFLFIHSLLASFPLSLSHTLSPTSATNPLLLHLYFARDSHDALFQLAFVFFQTATSILPLLFFE